MSVVTAQVERTSLRSEKDLMSQRPSSPPSSPKERPLPISPRSSQRPTSTYRHSLTPSISSVTAGKRKAVPVRALLGRVLQEAHIFHRLFLYLSWTTLHALLSSCREFRELFLHPHIRDIVLSEFIPGYRWCLERSDAHHHPEVKVDMHDLSLLIISQNMPLFRYPMHALSILSSPLHIPDLLPTDPLTTKYIAFTQAHSRFVLLLQSLLHSGHSFSTPLLSDDIPFWPTSANIQSLPGTRELIFPKPLSFADSKLSANQGTPTLAGKGRREGSTASSMSYPSYTHVRASSDFQALTSRRLSKGRLRPVMAIFGGSPKTPLPPPSQSPPAIRYHSTGWRRTLLVRKSGYSSSAASDDEDEPLPLPRMPARRSVSMTPSSDSSLGTPSPSSSRSNSKTNTVESVDDINWNGKEAFKLRISPDTPPHAHSSSPHDLLMATSPYRAPLLRVFVPCAQLDEIAISACEEQLFDAGIWENLSAGDIICNFGFVPPPEREDGTSSSSHEQQQSRHRKRWLIFNGYCLVHFIPPAPPPIENSLTLPSPFYYSHILPALSNPRFMLCLPPTSFENSRSRSSPIRPTLADRMPRLTLTRTRTRVASPHSPGGFAMVKKYMWLAKIPYVGPNSGTQAGEALGEGWQGEWILEAEGTKEGKQSLVDAMTADNSGATPPGLWEVVSDKSGGGRLWMRMITNHIDPTASELSKTAQKNSGPKTKTI